jgi:hypothetical protein
MKKLGAFILLIFVFKIAYAQVQVSVGEFNYRFDSEFICAYNDGYDSTCVFVLINSDSLILHTVTMNRHYITYKHIWRKAVAIKDVDMNLSWVNDNANNELYFLDIITKLPGNYVQTYLISLESISKKTPYPLCSRGVSNVIRIPCKTRNEAYDLLEKIK